MAIKYKVYQDNRKDNPNKDITTFSVISVLSVWINQVAFNIGKLLRFLRLLREIRQSNKITKLIFSKLSSINPVEAHLVPLCAHVGTGLVPLCAPTCARGGTPNV